MDENWNDCKCLEATQGLCAERGGVSIGTDTTDGRYGSVHLYTCPNCQRLWLFYAVDYAGFSESGRWYRGLITPETAATITPETAAQAIADAPYHVYGGCYFSTAGRIHVGPGRVSLGLYGDSVTPTEKPSNTG